MGQISEPLNECVKREDTTKLSLSDSLKIEEDCKMKPLSLIKMSFPEYYSELFPDGYWTEFKKTFRIAFPMVSASPFGFEQMFDLKGIIFYVFFGSDSRCLLFWPS